MPADQAMIERVGGFLESLGSARDLDAVWEGLRGLAEDLEFADGIVSVVGVDPATGEPRTLDYRSSHPVDQFEDYLRRGLERHDSVVAGMVTERRPFLLHTEWEARGEPSPMMREILRYDTMWDRPLRVGLPAVRGPDGAVWLVGFRGRQATREARAFFEGTAPILWLAAAAACDRLIDLSRPPAEAENPLTPRERECLLRLARGDRVDRIAERLAISNATVELHLANARRRLRARTSVEAVARAVRRGWIDP